MLKRLSTRFPVPDVLLVYALFAALTLAFHAGHLDVPMAGDEGYYYGDVVHHLAGLAGPLPSDPGLWLELYHPPPYYAVLALLVKLFGWKLPLFRVCAALSAAVLPTAVFALARTRAAAVTALAAALAFACGTTYLGTSLQILPDLLGAGCLLWALRALGQGKNGRASALFMTACLINAIVAATGPAFVVALRRRTRPGRLARELAWFFAPALLTLVAWSCYFLIRSHGVGDALTPTQYPFLSGPGLVLLRLLWRWPSILYLDEGRLILLTLIAGVALWRARRGRAAGASGSPAPAVGRAEPLTLQLCQLLLLAFFGYTSARYISASLACAFVLGAWALEELPSSLRKAVSLPAFAVLSLLGLLAWNAPSDGQGYNIYNSIYIDNLRALQKLSAELARRQPQPTLYTVYPWAKPLAVGFSGVTPRPFTAVDVAKPEYTGEVRRTPGDLLVFPSPVDPPVFEIRRNRIPEARAPLLGPCESWASGRGRFFACPMRAN